MIRKSETPAVIFGSGRQASHLFSLLEWAGLPWERVVMFDDAFPKLNVGPRNRPVMGNVEAGIEHCRSKGLTAFVALGSKCAARRYQIYSELKKAKVNLPNVIHPSCHLAHSVSLGDNIAMMAGCVIGPNVSIGSLCCFFSSVTLEHNTSVADNVVLGPSVVTSGDVQVGKHSFIGSGAVLAPSVKIGERVVIGAGSVVVSDIPPDVIAMGVPARVHRKLPPGNDAPTLDEFNNE